MKIISWNLLHRNGATIHDVVLLIQQEQPDALLLQEVKESFDELAELVGGVFARAPLPGRLHGLGIWTPVPSRPPPLVFDLPEGSLVSRICQTVDLGPFAVANVHLSHGQLLNRRQLRYIGRRLPARAAIMGDFNLVGPILLDGFRDVGPRHHTHRATGVLRLRLDRCVVRDVLCTGARILERGLSDHHPILVHLAVPSEIGQQ